MVAGGHRDRPLLSWDGIYDGSSGDKGSYWFRTVLGTVGFDANGDSLQQIVTLHRVGAPAAGTTLDWLVDKQQDFGPAP